MEHADRLITDNTAILPVPLVPEIRLHLAHEAISLWEKTEEELAEAGLPPPFWAFAWAGGQALARHVLDHPDIVRGKAALDLATGSGLVAIAAMKAGAASCLAADIDRFSVAAAQANARLNGVSLDVTSSDLLSGPAFDSDVVLVGDLFYERDLALGVIAWLDRCRGAGADVLIGDPGRSYLPKDRLEIVSRHQVPVTRALEDADIKDTRVWRLKG